MPCSVFENDETVAGWIGGRSVAYCERCFQEKIERVTQLSDENANSTTMEPQAPKNIP